jgi:hypothetical protein
MDAAIHAEPKFLRVRSGQQTSLIFHDDERFILWYNNAMLKKPLIETNPYLKDPEQRRALIYTTVTSSTAIETGHTVVDRTIQPSPSLEKAIHAAESEETYRPRR